MGLTLDDEPGQIAAATVLFSGGASPHNGPEFGAVIRSDAPTSALEQALASPSTAILVKR